MENVEQEVKTLKSFTGHENVLQFDNAFEDENYVYIVMGLSQMESTRLLSTGRLPMRIKLVSQWSHFMILQKRGNRSDLFYWRNFETQVQLYKSDQLLMP